MKNLKRIFAWIVFSLIIQFVGFFYLDKFYFASESNFRTKKVEDSKENKKKKVNIDIAEDSEGLSISYKGKYISYYEDKALKIVNTETGNSKEVSAEECAEISYYRWLPDRNRIIIAEKENGINGHVIKFYNYEVSKDIKEEIKETVHDASTFISLPDSESYVEDIALSTLSNVMYVKVRHIGKKSNVYRFDIMSQMTKLENMEYIIGDIGITHIEDHFLCEDLTYRKIRTNDNETINIEEVDNPCLIASDNEDKVYIGQLEEDDTIKKIYSGNIKEDTSNWNVIDLKSPVKKQNIKDIYVSPVDGKIYINDNFEGIVTEVNSGIQTKYKGAFIEMYTKGIASISDGKLVKTEFKQIEK